jgi:hypothetical protein
VEIDGIYGHPAILDFDSLASFSLGNQMDRGRCTGRLSPDAERTDPCASVAERSSTRT